MGDNETGQVSDEAARIYEDFYLPALFEEWSALVVETANIEKGHRVIDVACGTGALASRQSRVGSMPVQKDGHRTMRLATSS